MSTTSFYQHGFHVREFGSEGARSIFQDAQSGTPPELMPQDEMSQYDQGWSLLNKWQIIVATIFQVFSGRMCRIPHINGWLEFAPSIILRAIAIQEAMKSGVNTFQQQKHYRQMTTLAHLEKAQTMLQSDRSDMASDRLQWWDEIEQWQLGEHGIGYFFLQCLLRQPNQPNRCGDERHFGDVCSDVCKDALVWGCVIQCHFISSDATKQIQCFMRLFS